MIEIALGTLIILALVLALTAALLFARARLLPQGAATITLNGTQEIEVQSGETLLSCLQGAGFAIPAGCGGKGTCGLCRVTATGPGAGEALAAERGLLSARDRKAGMRLACQVTLKGPVNVEVAPDLLSAETMQATVRSNRMLAPLIRELVLDLPEGQKMDFHAGYFMQLTAPAYRLSFRDIEVSERFAETWEDAGWRDLSARSAAPVTRAYSIASRPEDVGRAVFNIRLAVPPAGAEGEIPPGLVSSYLFALKPGDPLAISGPFGEFRVQDTQAEMILIGGGVGMAPLRAMIHEQVGREQESKGAPRKMRYFYGARSAIDLFYTEEFDAIAAAHPNFRWTPALSDPAPGDRWTGATGFIHERVADALRDHPAPNACEYYLCGPPMMISAVIATLMRFGVERHRIYNDDFGA
ncbi:NADH:ubiquinone reductase (Na(+)-transporting) subunit F [Maritimibacter alkaliphilus]|uniref:NADH:ubiquinone reductase (Na(+)-transporting) subunit F n=1 Tax=Maritimibacter alkaliphilus TaxID=404236 RepID=UPI001C93F205|nr:NADH:ubiquinone reductase (Na(+)-transporting) subunit F [Maritimibacter alkaliphilus]MBY6090708.1 NADH:ubiquinone reductase (Na(+)-transporting) subunit F [Maritimibacter alkaliphilus]